jgi:hypothetical protein
MVDLALARILAEVESSNRLNAIRFEPTQLRVERSTDLLFRITDLNGCDDATAKMIAATSWGRYQLMGFNLYTESAPEFSIVQFLTNSVLQNEMLDEFLTANKINWTWADLSTKSGLLTEFATRYNGPGDPSGYAFKMFSAARALSLSSQP